MDQKWIYQLHKPGTSLGGARPKANVIDEDGLMKMAKFPSRNDTFDVELWEHIAHVLAKNAKINVAETRMIISAIMVSCLLRKDGLWLRHLT